MKAHITRLPDLPGIPCPCGTARRAFVKEMEGKATLHFLEVKKDSELHYHERLTEIYYVLSGSGQMELDGEVYPLSAGDAVSIPPGTVHRAIPGSNKLQLLNFVMPAFDPSDEWLVS